MKQRIKELGAYCVEHDISLDDLKQIRKELRTEKLKNESLNNEHFKRFLSLKNKLPFIKSSAISIFFSWYSTSPAQKRLIFCARALDDEFAIYFASFKRFMV